MVLFQWSDESSDSERGRLEVEDAEGKPADGEPTEEKPAEEKPAEEKEDEMEDSWWGSDKTDGSGTAWDEVFNSIPRIPLAFADEDRKRG